MQFSPFVNESLHRIKGSDGRASQIQSYEHFLRNDQELYSSSGGIMQLPKNHSSMQVDIILLHLRIRVHFRHTMVFSDLIHSLARTRTSKNREHCPFSGEDKNLHFFYFSSQWFYIIFSYENQHPTTHQSYCYLSFECDYALSFGRYISPERHS
jgi:hypothetical protein